MSEAPPYRITPAILSLVEQIGEALGRADALGIARDLRLRRISRIRSIRGSLAIEGNTLSEEQVATLLDGKPVIGPLREIQEAATRSRRTTATNRGHRAASETCCARTAC